MLGAKKEKKIKNKKLPSKWLPGRKHLILAETGVESVLVPPAWFHFNPFHPYKYGALIASIPSFSLVNVDSKYQNTSSPTTDRRSRLHPTATRIPQTTPTSYERDALLRNDPIASRSWPIDKLACCSLPRNYVTATRQVNVDSEVPVHDLLDLYAANKPAKIRADQKK